MEAMEADVCMPELLMGFEPEVGVAIGADVGDRWECMHSENDCSKHCRNSV